jgi:sulfate permease, SulP family
LTDAARRFKPKLLTVLKEGYGTAALRQDVLAGATVAVVALPLSMAIAIACGLPPTTGLVTAIVGGLLVSALGGSRFQIGGPAGAFIVPVAATLASHGLKGLILATFLSGVFLILAGALRLGRFVRLIPSSVVLGFSLGIALIISASQLHDALGLDLSQKEPAELLLKLQALFGARDTFSLPAALVCTVTIGIVVAFRAYRPNWPGMLIAIAAVTAIVMIAGLKVETLGDRFGVLSSVWPALTWPDISPQMVIAVLPSALSFTLLGAIESLLSAVVADSMTTRQHRPEAELVAQGFANIGASLFGGFCVTGTIARTATNIRAGAHGPMAGIFHALFVLLAFLLLMPLASHIPFAALAGVLLVVAFNMVERHELQAIMRSSWSGILALSVTCLGVLFVDLIIGIALGCAVAGLGFWLKSRARRPS